MGGDRPPLLGWALPLFRKLRSSNRKEVNPEEPEPSSRRFSLLQGAPRLQNLERRKDTREARQEKPRGGKGRFPSRSSKHVEEEPRAGSGRGGGAGLLGRAGALAAACRDGSLKGGKLVSGQRGESKQKWGWVAFWIWELRGAEVRAPGRGVWSLLPSGALSK